MNDAPDSRLETLDHWNHYQGSFCDEYLEACYASLAFGAPTIGFPDHKYSLPWYLKQYLLKWIEMFWSKVMFLLLRLCNVKLMIM